MTSIQLSAKEYRNLVKMDNKKHLLVEGATDVVFFSVLFDEFLGDEWREEHDIELDNAETLISLDGHIRANREKIEEICKISSEAKLLGFVDREFRKFITEANLVDELKSHYQENNLFWSRGHSVENYYFEAEILRYAFQDICGEEFQKANILFRKNIKSYMQIACALGLVSLKFNYVSRARIIASFGWNIISSSGDLDIEAWKLALSRYSGLSDEDTEEITNFYQEMLSLTKQAESDIVRWLCHGHLGFDFLWHAFSSCIYEACDGDETARRKAVHFFIRHQNTIGFKLCVRSLAKAAIRGFAEYPSKIIDRLI